MDQRRRNQDFPGETVDSTTSGSTWPVPGPVVPCWLMCGGPTTHPWSFLSWFLGKLMTHSSSVLEPCVLPPGETDDMTHFHRVHLDPLDSTLTLGTRPIGWSLCSRATCFVFNGEIWHFILFCWSNNFLAVSDQTGFISMRVFRLWYLQMMKQDKTKIFCGKTFSWLTNQPFS